MKKIWKDPKSRKVLLCGLIVFLSIGIVFLGVRGFTDGFTKAESQQREAISVAAYEEAYKKSEEDHHTSNRVEISVEDLKEQKNLKVLEVRDQAISAEDIDHSNIFTTTWDNIFGSERQSWIKAQGEGVFIVNMEDAEITVDEENVSVGIVLPKPVLKTPITVDPDAIEELYSHQQGWFSSASDGEEAERETLQKLASILEDQMKDNENFIQAAKRSATSLVTGMVQQLNPDLPEIEVNITFADEK